MIEYGVALVTGAASGIGRATAKALAVKGARVILADIDLPAIEEAATQIIESGGIAVAIQLDVTDEKQVNGVFDFAKEWDKEVDILVNSAGVIIIDSILEFSLENWNRLMAINVTGSFLCAQRAGRDMMKNRYGRIINLASISGVRAGVGRVAYGTSKAAVIGLTRQFSLELGGSGITANCVAPGAIVTSMTKELYNEETRNSLCNSIPARRLGTAEEVADTIVFISSPKSSYINGEMITVDGGFTSAGMAQTGELKLVD